MALNQNKTYEYVFANLNVEQFISETWSKTLPSNFRSEKLC